MNDTIVETTSGPVSGIKEDGVYRYLGIPYAAPPIGDRRWKPPVPPQPWKMIRPAIRFGPACCQSMLSLDPSIEEVSEDCLYLNVWTPSIKPSDSLPVMVYLHGGGFARGSGSSPVYNQPFLARKGIVLVTVNYRLGAFGFLAHPALSSESHTASSGNYGLMDQIEALTWVQRNAGRFGGDPGNITLFGQSAGGASVTALMASPLSEGLFHRAIAQSCGYAPLSIRELSEPGEDRAAMETLGLKFAAVLGLPQNECSASSLRSLPWQEVVSAWETSVQNVTAGSGIPGAWAMNHIVVDGYVLTRSPGAVFNSGQQRNIPFMTGITADEGTLLAQLFHISSREKYISYIKKRFGRCSEQVLQRYPASGDSSVPEALGKLLGDSFTCGASILAERMCVIQPHTYLYKFSAQPKMLVLRMPGVQEYKGQFGCYHSAELPYVFNSLKGPAVEENDRTLAEEIMGYWTRFAISGNPNGGNSVFWPAYSKAERSYLDFGRSIESKNDPLCAQQDFIEGLDT